MEFKNSLSIKRKSEQSMCAWTRSLQGTYIKLCYVRLPDLLNELAVAHGDGTLEKVIKAYQKIDLLILDEFSLSPESTEQTRELLEIIDACSVKGSLIFCTQVRTQKGLAQLHRK